MALEDGTEGPLDVSVDVTKPLLDSQEKQSDFPTTMGVSAVQQSGWQRAAELFVYPFKILFNNGVFCTIFAQVLLSMLGVTFKMLTDMGISGYEVLVARSASNAAMSLIVCLMRTPRGTLLIPRNIWGLSFAQSSFGNLSMALLLLSSTMIPQGSAMALGRLSPVFAVVLGSLLGWERLSIPIVGGAIICAAGAVVVEHPPFLFGGGVDWDTNYIVGSVFALSCSLCFAIMGITSGRIGSQVDTLTLTLWYNICGIFVNIGPLIAGYPSPPVLILGWDQWLILTALCFISFAVVFFNIRGLQLCNATLGTSLMTTVAIFSYVLAYAFFGEHITVFAMVGTVSIIIGIVVIAKGKEKLNASQDKLNTSQDPIEDGENEA